MENLLAHPAIQGGVAPFIVAFLIALIFVRVNLLAGLAMVAGFVVVVFLTTGFSFSPMTSTRKLTLIVLLVPVVAFIFQLGNKYLETLIKVACILISASLLWILWPVLIRGSIDEMLFPVLSYLIYAVWMVAMFMRMAELPAVTAGTSALACGIAIGGSAVIGASALLGQMGIAMAVAGGAFLLVQLLFRSEEFAGLPFTLTSGFLAALLLPVAVVYAKVPWLVLPVVALIPLISFYPFADDDRLWRNTVALLVGLAFPIGLAFYLTMQNAGEILF